MNIIAFEKKKDHLRTRYRYALYERRLIRDGTIAYSRSFIVLKNQYGVIVHFSNFHRYVARYGDAVYRPLASDAREKLLYVCEMLNYVLVDRHDITGAGHVFQIKREMLEAFFRDYALIPLSNGNYRSRQSIEKCVSSVTMFFRRLCLEHGDYMAVSIDQLFVEKPVRGTRGKIVNKLVPDFQVRGIPENKSILRDIPTEAFAILLNQAFKHMPEIAFAICVQAFAGLRPGEAMSVRQEISPIKPGMTVSMIGGMIKSAEIDLSREYALRSDGVVCGRIKRERRQKVHPAFLQAFAVAYERHKAYLKSTGFEPAYCPMFVNRSGKAMTYAAYRGRFKKLVENHLRPALLDHVDAECRLYGLLLCEKPLGLHSLRPWSTVALVLMGEDVAQLQYWRGDASPESALSYLQNKGELVRALNAANNNFAELLIRGVTE